ncbi:MAG: type IA DNA topoisomerase [Verrucomicrobia bacterium]|nr:MAG: type IA DNA topoisomerase [Verrucomicrobiota bacterium]
MKSLVIAEKPSVAADLAKALGKVPKKGDVYENDQWVISSAVGHLVELEMPEDIDKKKYGFWRLETLPIIPEAFGLKPIEDNKEKFSQLKKLLARKDVDQVINACDAGREGELIFVYIYQLAKSKLPVKRAWMQSMTADGITKAFDKLRDGAALAGLADAARCRSESDWLIGINGTRALTKRMFGSRAGNVASVGRVQTPTLAIVYTRELEIRNFKPRAYWKLTAQFQVALGTYEGVYQRPDFKRDTANEHDRIDRLWEQPRAEAVLAECRSQPTAAVREEKKPTTQASPRLYDLTTLQREANGRFGLSARRTLQIAQALYERHKMITYPRTDSRALPEDYASTVRDTLQALVGDLSAHAAKVVQSGWIRPGNKKIFNNAQISDHFAIIPTTSEPKNLDEMEAKVYDLIARRFVAAFYPEAQFDVTTRISTVAGKHAFKTEGKVLTEAGWLAVYGKSAALEDDFGGEAKKESSGASKTPLVALSPADAQRAKVAETKLHHETTKPPPRYTEATLLSAMEGAGKLVEDEDMAEAMKERGLGTPATRADTIDGLINQKYMERQQRELVPTPKAESLIQFLGAVKAEALTSPAMTGDWEFKLRQMEQGRVKRDDFMKEVIAQTVGIVERVKGFEEDESNSRTTDIVSPTDGQPMYETLRGYKTQDGTLMIYKVMTGRKIEEQEVRQLVTTGEVGPLDGFVSPRNGARFAAKLKIVDDEKSDLPGRKKVAMDFGEKTEVGDLTSFWTDPKTGAQLCEAPTKYILRTQTGEGSWEQAFSLSRILCKRELTRDDVITCIATGRTPLIENFTSKFGRPFKAFLVRAGAKANFEFPPREAKTGKDGKVVERKAKAKLDLSAAKKLGPSPAHKEGELYETDDAFVVAKPGADDTPRAVFTSKREVAGKPLTAETIRQLLTEGRTELIDGFMSKAGRAFSAYLVLSKDKKKAEFEFPPR